MNSNVETVANVNTNHSADGRSAREANVSTDRSYSTKNSTAKTSVKVKSQVVIPNSVESVRFEEDGEQIQMDISDGGVATVEFASEDSNNYANSESDSEVETDIEMMNCDGIEGTENGEILSQSEQSKELTAVEIEKEHSKDKHNVKQRQSSQQSVQEQLASMNSALLAMQEMITSGGLTKGASMGANGKDRGVKPGTSGTSKVSKQAGMDMVTESNSDMTIYQNMLEKESSKVLNETEIFQADSEIEFKLKDSSREVEKIAKPRNSSSSEDDRVDTSDELIEFEMNNVNVNEFIADCESEAKRRKDSLTTEKEKQVMDPVQEQSEQIIHEAEASRARILSTSGKCQRNLTLINQFEEGRATATMPIQHSAQVDENYIVVGGHLDLALKEKIILGEYVDFARLLPRSKPAYNDDGHLELVNRGGQTYFIPANRDQGAINNFHKWEQAFRVYSNVYTQEFPGRAAELIQYNHIIFTASSTYVWDNVYNYNCEFRTHLSYYPQ